VFLTSATTGTAHGVIAYFVPPNTRVAALTYTIPIADKLFFIHQDAATPCTYVLTAPASIDSSQQPVTVSVNTGASCTWTISSDQLWLPLNSSGPETGGRSMSVTASANDTGAPRTATLLATGSGPLAGTPASITIVQR
jgi:hypothetical protein